MNTHDATGAVPVVKLNDRSVHPEQVTAPDVVVPTSNTVTVITKIPPVPVGLLMTPDELTAVVDDENAGAVTAAPAFE